MFKKLLTISLVLFMLTALPLFAGNKNDLAYLNIDELDTSAAIGASDGILVIESNIPKQGGTVADILTANNVMTTAGDIIYGGASGVQTRLAVGTNGTFLGGGTNPSYISGAITAQVSVSLAELNAGKTIIAAVTGKQIVVLDFNFVMDGAFGTLTSAELEDSSATVNVCSLAQAQMTDDAVLTKGITGVTLGVGIAEGITVSEALVITVTGAAADTATGLTVVVTYMLI